MTDYRVSGYTNNRAYHLDRPAYTVIVRDDPGLAPVRDRAMQRANQLAEEMRGLRRFRVVPVTQTDGSQP